MWSLLGKNGNECNRVRAALEDAADMTALGTALQEHLRVCNDCQAAVDELLMSRKLLQALPSQAVKPAPWFAPRVMAAIGAREAELRRSLDAWSLVPKLAARLTWVTALALLLAGTWLYQTPGSTAVRSVGDSGNESLFDWSATPATDDLLSNRLEQQQ
ncbi:MAG TPA: hypothetical protein VN920_03555 [Pyrinomonadaceae bacterium]|nr:hypothetical protein [Pyrinomonadaceae bacterium]